MRNIEKLYEMICLETGETKTEVTEIVDAINRYDWDCFNSQMGDYDHPEERIEARKVLNEKMKSHNFTTVSKIWNLLGNGNLNPRQEKIRDFYNNKFHSLSEEYVEA